MKKILPILLILCIFQAFGQASVALTPGGFESVKFDKPDLTNEKLMERAKGWAPFYNRNIDYPYDVYDVTENSLSIDAHKSNAFFYRNRGEIYYHRIRYTLKVNFSDNIYTVTFIVKEIYTDNTLTKLSTGDFFAPDGRLKEDYEEVKPSLEDTANTIINSFAAYMNKN